MSAAPRPPTFLIIGERRCGTTALDRWLDAHPDVWLHPHRDSAYFVEQEIVGRTEPRDGEVDAGRWEATHDPDAFRARFRDAGAQRAVGEKSADHLFWRPAHARIARFAPEARLIVSLRDPVDRAWSPLLERARQGP